MKKYLQVLTSISADIQSGLYTDGDQLPTEMELAEKYLVSRQSIRQALGLLEGKGIIRKIRGSGSYVSSGSNLPQKTMRIAVIVVNIDSYIIPGILREIETICTQNHYSIQLMSTSNSVAKERNILQSMLAHPVDGILVEATKSALPNPNLSIYRELASQNMPIVFFNSIYPELLCDANSNILAVTMDDYGGAHEMTMNLIQEGHSSIGGIFSCEGLQGVRCYSGFIDALTQSHLGLVDQHVLLLSAKDIDSHVISIAIQKLLADCTAIICQNNEVANLIAACIRTLPVQKSVIAQLSSFPVSGSSEVQVRSLMYPKEKFGQSVANKVIAMINGTLEENLVMSWSFAI